MALRQLSDGRYQTIEYTKSAGIGRHSRYVAGGTRPSSETHNLCTVTLLEDGSANILSHIQPPPDRGNPNCFLEVLDEWGCNWLWNKIKMSNSTGQGVGLTLHDGGTWIYKAIREGTLVCVSDGSYVKEICLPLFGSSGNRLQERTRPDSPRIPRTKHQCQRVLRRTPRPTCNPPPITQLQ